MKIIIKLQYQKHKYLMLALVNNYYPWCNKLENETLSNTQVDKNIKRRNIPLILNSNLRKYPKKFTFPINPVILFIDSKTQGIDHQIIDYMSFEAFLDELDSMNFEDSLITKLFFT